MDFESNNHSQSSRQQESSTSFVTKLGDWNHDKRDVFAWIFNFCNVCLLLFSFGWILIISSFVGDGIFEHNKDIMDPLLSYATQYMIIGIIVILTIVGCGHCLNKQQQPRNQCIAVYGAFLLLVGALPFLGEAQLLHQISHLNETDLRPDGDLKGQQLAAHHLFCHSGGHNHGQKIPDKPMNKYSAFLVDLATKYDQQNEVMLDKFMCTEVCPCFSVPTWKKDHDGNKLYRIDAKAQYSKIHEETLNKHHRTWNGTVLESGYIPFEFTSNETLGFSSFQQCFDSWLVKSKEDITINLMDIFDLKWTTNQLEEYKEISGITTTNNLYREKNSGDEDTDSNMEEQEIARRREYLVNQDKKNRAFLEAFYYKESKERKGEKQLKKIMSYSVVERQQMMMGSLFQTDEILASVLQSKFISRVENNMDCSGICNNALFYYSRSTLDGYPEETCLIKLVDYLRRLCGPLETECEAVGSIMFVLFIIHFSFYGRKKREQHKKKGSEDAAQAQAGVVGEGQSEQQQAHTGSARKELELGNQNYQDFQNDQTEGNEEQLSDLEVEDNVSGQEAQAPAQKGLDIDF